LLNSTVLDVAVGLIFTFLAVSLAVSAIVEAIASQRGWRAATLIEGVKKLLNDPNLEGLALKIYNHALVNPLDSGTARGHFGLKNLPSYIDPGEFADALLQITNTASAAPAEIEGAIRQMQDEQLRHLFQGIYDRTEGNVTRMRSEIAAWFDNGMDRVGGIYKRQTQLWSFVIAAGLAAAWNIDTIAFSRALWQQPMLARTIASTDNPMSRDAVLKLAQLQLPIGWTCERFHQLATLTGIEMVAGWLITAFATLFGAPFWFDTLQQFVRIKGSGPSPLEKQNRTGAAA
jgi:hypothetical protein